MITETAPAKINLYLHVGPLRADGLHDLASLFVFTEDGDVITVEPASDISLQVTGPFASALKGAPPEQNLVWKAAALLQSECGVTDGAAITLEKNLPVAAGVGGGSADAAAALRALIRLWNVEIAQERLERFAFSLGADVPACLKRTPMNVSGAGETLSPGPSLAPMWVSLVNPRIGMPTGPVFRAFDAANQDPEQPFLAPSFAASCDGARVLMATTRNDLEAPARALAPAIGKTLSFLAQRPGALGARMSGSGATCFALFPSAEGARRTERAARSCGWWALASRLCVG